MTSLSGKAALVTGGSRGMGAAIAKRLAAEGAAVALTYSASADRATAVVREIEAGGGKALAIAADSADPDAVQRAVDAAVAAHGRLDILVNNAGIVHYGPVGDATLADFERVLAVNVRGMFVAIQAALRHMGRGGRIVNIGSVNSERVPNEGLAIYAMSKGAVAGLTRGLARELGARGITINNVQPGPVDTELNPASGAFAEMLMPHMAIGRYGKAEEVAGLVAYLARDEAAYVTGAHLAIDGGFLV